MGTTDTKVYHIYTKVKQAIEAGNIAPGERLIIRKLAQEHNVSEIPVREALIQLSKEGLIHNVPHSGMRVTEISHKKLEDILVLREALEPFAARLAADNMDRVGLDKLKNCLGQMEEHHKSNSLDMYSSADKEFHSIIVDYSGNDELREFLYRVLSMQSYVMKSFNIYPRILESSISEHRLITEFLELRDGHLVEKIMYIHRKKYSNMFKEYCHKCHKKN